MKRALIGDRFYMELIGRPRRVLRLPRMAEAGYRPNALYDRAVRNPAHSRVAATVALNDPLGRWRLGDAAKVFRAPNETVQFLHFKLSFWKTGVVSVSKFWACANSDRL
ncbi:hypothetical protein [Flaviaesturariibacter amylovorans]|uniref:hypothetical protein n=1 Tax=Flaviaesturariibacter amylovorans TaxID=1084520 RepID=UPI0031E7237E